MDIYAWIIKVRVLKQFIYKDKIDIYNIVNQLTHIVLYFTKYLCIYISIYLSMYLSSGHVWEPCWQQTPELRARLCCADWRGALAVLGGPGGGPVPPRASRRLEARPPQAHRRLQRRRQVQCTGMHKVPQSRHDHETNRYIIFVYFF